MAEATQSHEAQALNVAQPAAEQQFDINQLIPAITQQAVAAERQRVVQILGAYIATDGLDKESQYTIVLLLNLITGNTYNLEGWQKELNSSTEEESDKELLRILKAKYETDA